MPELPEVETIKRTLAEILPGRTIKEIEIRLEKLVRPDPETFRQRLLGQRFEALSRRGKILILELEKTALLVHFRLTGQLVFLPPGAEEPPYTHLLFFLDQGRLAYADLRQFGWLEVVDKDRLKDHPALKGLGPEPFALSPEEFFRRLRSHRRRLKALLLDQRFLAGLGNIYVDESLFRAGLHPERLSHTLTKEEAFRLHQVILEVLEKAISTRGSSVRNYVDGQGQEGEFQNFHLVYRKRGEPCPRCGTPIVYFKVASRGTYVCPQCQK